MYNILKTGDREVVGSIPEQFSLFLLKNSGLNEIDCLNDVCLTGREIWNIWKILNIV